ncbi:AMP-binding enzyme domain-containing protein [Ditylenchus destructor]|nr:AMP-binding enzyme domain-containing protein [Ditylenchus destructor]
MMRSYAQWLACGYVVNCPESASTVSIDLKEIGPTYYFAPPRVFEGLLTSVMIRMEDAGAIKRWIFARCMDLARRVGPALMDGQSVGTLDRWKYRLGDALIYGPLRNTLGFSRVRVAYTAGEAIGPDLFSFYRSIGINLKQLYGSTETAVFVCLQPDHEAKSDTVGVPIDGVEIRLAESGEILVRSPGLLKGYYKNPQATAEVLDAEGWYRTGDAGFLDAGGPSEDHRPRQGRGGGLRRRARSRLRLHQHRRRGGGQLGRAPQPPLCRLHRFGGQARGLCADQGLRAAGQRGPGAGRAPGGQPDHPLPGAAQGAGRRRRRAHPHPQGPPRRDRGEVRAADRRALRGQALAVHRDGGPLRGRPYRQGRRRPAHRGGRHLLSHPEGRLMSATIAAPGSALFQEAGAQPATPAATASSGSAATGRRIGDVILEARGITLSFGGVKALNDISFDVREHEIRAIIGPNGAGKSSMLNCINGVYQPQQGSVMFRGQDMRKLSPRVRFAPHGRDGRRAHLPEPGAVQGHERAGQHHDRPQPAHEAQPAVAGAARWTRGAGGDRPSREGRAHHRFPLEIQAHRKTPVGGLPYGLQKRVELGRALAMEPELLLLDEPMAGMNLEEKEDMCRFILDVNDEFGTTIVLIEHDMGVVMDISDRVVVLDYGRKIGDGTPDEVRANPEVIRAYLGAGE